MKLDLLESKMITRYTEKLRIDEKNRSCKMSSSMRQCVCVCDLSPNAHLKDNYSDIGDYTFESE